LPEFFLLLPGGANRRAKKANGDIAENDSKDLISG